MANAMDWLSQFGGQPHDEEVDDDNEDFYGYGINSNGDAKPGAMEAVGPTRLILERDKLIRVASPRSEYLNC